MCVGFLFTWAHSAIALWIGAAGKTLLKALGLVRKTSRLLLGEFELTNMLRALCRVPVLLQRLNQRGINLRNSSMVVLDLLKHGAPSILIVMVLLLKWNTSLKDTVEPWLL